MRSSFLHYMIFLKKKKNKIPGITILMNKLNIEITSLTNFVSDILRDAEDKRHFTFEKFMHRGRERHLKKMMSKW